jgi:hypothetical protein
MAIEETRRADSDHGFRRLRPDERHRRHAARQQQDLFPHSSSSRPGGRVPPVWTKV